MTSNFQQFQDTFKQIQLELKAKRYIHCQMSTKLTTKERVNNVKTHWRLLTHLKYMKIDAMQSLSDFNKGILSSNLHYSDLASFLIVYGVEIIAADVTINLVQDLIFQIANGFDFGQNFKTKLYELSEQTSNEKPALLQISDAVKRKVLNDIIVLITYTYPQSH
jgi:hypothetical protein